MHSWGKRQVYVIMCLMQKSWLLEVLRACISALYLPTLVFLSIHIHSFNFFSIHPLLSSTAIHNPSLNPGSHRSEHLVPTQGGTKSLLLILVPCLGLKFAALASPCLENVSLCLGFASTFLPCVHHSPSLAMSRQQDEHASIASMTYAVV